MTYTMKPAGHKAPEEKREYVRPDSRLQSVFEEWMDGTLEKRNWSYINSFRTAERLVSNLEATVEETHGLIITYKNHPKIIEAGIFLSAIYQNVTEQQITYDLDIPLHGLGYKLPAKKTLINNGTTGGLIGVKSFGSVINNGTTGKFLGDKASGPVINNGETGDSMGEWASGIVLALKEPESYGNLRKARIFKPEQIESNPELHDYLTALCEQTKAFNEHSVIPSNFAETIKQEIERLL